MYVTWLSGAGGCDVCAPERSDASRSQAIQYFLLSGGQREGWGFWPRDRNRLLWLTGLSTGYVLLASLLYVYAYTCTYNVYECTCTGM